MIPQILLNVVQIGAKYMIDLDPTITEYLTKSFVFKAMSFAQNSGDMLLQMEHKCASTLMPLVDGLRTLRLHSNT
jgi:DUF917 family protein